MSEETSSMGDTELDVVLWTLRQSVTSECRQASTLILAGFLVVGILLIIPALMQTAAAYLWVGQCEKQLKRQQVSNVAKNLHNRNLTKMTRDLFVYRILACLSSLFVLVFSTLPQLVLAVANPIATGNIDARWGWCQSFIYMDNTTRCFATYLVVVPFVIFFWDFFFTEVIPNRQIVMKQIFHGILVASIPIGLLCYITPVPLVYYRYDKVTIDGVDYCSSNKQGTLRFLVFDFVSTRVIPTTVLISVGCAFLIWLPKRDYGVFYEPFIFLILNIPLVILESTIYLFHYLGYVNLLLTPQFSNVLIIFYSFYHLSFSCTFVLATIRSVFSEIREERRARACALLGEPLKTDERKTKRQNNVIRGLQRQFSVAFRWRSECTEDELHLEDHMNDRKPSASLSRIEEAVHDEEQEGAVDDVTMHYSILRRSASFKPPQTNNIESSSKKMLVHQNEVCEMPHSILRVTPRQNTEPAPISKPKCTTINT